MQDSRTEQGEEEDVLHRLRMDRDQVYRENYRAEVKELLRREKMRKNGIN
jgi:hypothetical protein